MKSGGKWLLVVFVALIAAWAGTELYRSSSTTDPESDRTVAQLLGMPFTTAEGQAIKLADWQGRILVVNFWATWCPPCVNEMPLLQEVYNNRKGEGIEVIGINYNEDYERVKKFISEKGVVFTILIDSDLKVSMDYGVIGLPVTFFIDREGRIKEKFKGELNKKLIEDILNRF